MKLKKFILSVLSAFIIVFSTVVLPTVYSADLSVYPLADNYTTFLSQQINSTVLTLNVTETGDWTFPAGVTTYAVIDPGKSKMEVVELSAKDDSANTFTITNRARDLGNGITGTAFSHSTGSKVLISDSFVFWDAMATAINAKVDTDQNVTFTGNNIFQGTTNFQNEVTFTGTTIGGIRMNNLTTTERDALGSPANGMIIYNSTTGAMNQYIGGAWTTFATGSVVNASETVAGKVEIATTAEFDAGTDTGGTGAILAVIPSMLGATTTEITQLSGTTNIAEADTFFGATDATGAEMETLTDGSDSSLLHYHDLASERFTTPRISINALYNSAVMGTGTIVGNGWGATLTTQASSGFSQSSLIDFADVDSDISGNSPKFFVRAIFNTTTNQDGNIGFSGTPLNHNQTLTDDHAAFLVADATIVASVADGTTQEKSADLSGTYAINAIHEYYIAESGGNYLFYIDGVLVHTSTANEPNSGLISSYVGLIASENVAKNMEVYHHSISFDE